MKLAVFKFNHLGDNIAFLPAFQALRRFRPDWPLTLLTAPGLHELYGGATAPSELLSASPGKFNASIRNPWVLAKWAWRVRSRRFDACLLPYDQGNAAHLIARLSGAKVRVGARADGVRIRGSLTREVSAPGDGRPITWSWDIATSLVRESGGAGSWPEGAPRPDLSHLLKVRVPAKAGCGRIAIHAGSRLPLNRWPAAAFAQVADQLAGDFEVIWLEHGESTAEAPAHATRVRVATLSELASWLASADLFLGNNSGPMHLADALGLSGVVVSGPTARGWDPYWQPERWSVLRASRLACCPCEQLTRTTTQCANLAEPMACMGHWTASAVAESCRNLLRA